MKCGDNPSFFANTYLHIEFIQCILDNEMEGLCQRRQEIYDKERVTTTTTTTTESNSFDKKCGRV